MGKSGEDSYRIETIVSEDQFSDKKTEWKTFEKEQGYIDFNNSYDFLFSFWQHFKNASHIKELGLARQLVILFLYEHDKLKAIFPLWKITRKRKKIFHVTSIEFIGQQFFSNYNDIITKGITSGEFDIVKKWLFKNQKFDLIFLSHIPAFSKNISSIYKKELYPFSRCAEIRLTQGQTYQDYKSAVLSGNFKHIINNAYNRIKKSNIRFGLVFKDFEEEDFEELQRIAGFKTERGKYNVYADKQKGLFLSGLYKKFNAKILYIQFDEVNVSFLTYIHFNNQKVWFDMAFDTAYSKFRPGILLYDNCLKESIKQGDYYNVVGWGLDFHKRFCNQFVTLYQYLQKGNTLGSKRWYILKERQIKKAAEEYNEYVNTKV